MPSADTTECLPIGDLVRRHLRGVSVDPFSRNSALATHTNDLNPATAAQHHMQATDFLAMLARQGVVADVVIFDPAKLSYEQLLGYFFRMHDPTTLNQQHNDKGTQYRSAIFYTSDEQKLIAEAVKAQVAKSGKWKRPIVTEITKASGFYPAEVYHQKYLVKNPGGYTCHYLRD